MDDENPSPSNVKSDKYETTVNVNCQVRVKPTAVGLEVIRAERERFRLMDPETDWSEHLKLDENGCLTMPLWRFMRVSSVVLSN